MELHTLGVSGGPSGSTYTQQDVQELARVLTGAGLASDTHRGCRPRCSRCTSGAACSSSTPRGTMPAPRRCWAGPWPRRGWPASRKRSAISCRQPATAKYITTKLATYFVADEPPAALLAKLARTFQRTDGSIAAVLREMFLDRTFLASLEAPAPRLVKFKDPFQFVVSSLRFAYDAETITNYRPIVGWLTALGEPLYGRVTPDGYPLTEPAWTSSGQLIRRFEIARAIGSGNAGLFNLDDNTPGPSIGFPMLSSRLFFDAVEPGLSAPTRKALAGAASQQEWNTLCCRHPTGSSAES